jgi:hypothetical protein
MNQRLSNNAKDKIPMTVCLCQPKITVEIPFDYACVGLIIELGTMWVVVGVYVQGILFSCHIP